MSGTYMSAESLCNQALDRIAWPQAIGDIYEGSKEARIALRIYGQTRDKLILSGDWPFARQEAPLTLLKTAPVGGYGAAGWTSAYPLLPWIYEYAYPAGCLKLRSVRPTAVIMPEFDPVPNIFTVANDPASSTKIILTNLAGAIGSFTASVPDPTQWSPLAEFTEALISALALRFQEALNPAPEAVKDRVAEQQISAATANQG